MKRILKLISTKSRRRCVDVKLLNCPITGRYFQKVYLIELKAFGVFWISLKKVWINIDV